MVADMENFYVRTNGDVEKYCSEALKYIDDGYLVVTEYEHMAIGGLEATRPCGSNIKIAFANRFIIRRHFP